MHTLLKRLWYAYIKLIVGIAQGIYYRRNEVAGAPAKQAKSPVMYAVRHANGLMDPLMVSTLIPRQLNFLVRADVFKSKLAAGFLGTLNMMPVFRLRDGWNGMGRNESTFMRCQVLFQQGKAIQIFPEGNHNGDFRVAKLRKGTARITFQALSTMPGQEIFILPVGLHYENGQRFRSHLAINFGPPIAVSSFLDQDNPMSPQALTALTRSVEDGLKAQVIDLAAPAPYVEAHHVFQAICLHRFGQSYPRFALLKNLEQQIVRAFADPAQSVKLKELAQAHHTLLVEAKSPEKGVSAQTKVPVFPWFKLVLLGLLLPFFLVGSVLHSPVILLANRVTRLAKGPIFYSAIRMITAMFATQALYLLYFCLLWALLPGIGFAILGLISIIGCGILAIPAYDYLTDFRRNRRLRKFQHSHLSLCQQLRDLQIKMDQVLT